MKAKGLSFRAQEAFGVIVVAMMLGAGRVSAQGVAPTPMIQVRVVDETGAAVDAGRAVIDSLNRWALIERGIATITDLPSGRWTVTLRVLGFRPESVTLEAAPQPASVPVVTMHRIAQKLAPVEVTAVLSNKDSLVLREIDRRLRVANGSVITAENLAVRNATRATDPLGMARGFRFKSATVVEARSGCRSLPVSDSMDAMRRNKPKVVAIYLDGNRLPGGLESINRMVPPSDILAIEAYPDVISAPFLWRTNDACAVVAFWTKKPPPVTVGR
jgi:hypothetical protein